MDYYRRKSDLAPEVLLLAVIPAWNQGPTSGYFTYAAVLSFMIRGYQPHPRIEPVGGGRIQFGPAVTAGLIGGAVLLLVPMGDPWASSTFFSPVIMGRTLTGSSAMPLPLAWAIHMALSVLYGLILSRAVAGVGLPLAIIVGALLGAMLYSLNFFAVVAFWPQLRGNELAPFIAHLAFGLIAAAAYRGLLRRQVVAGSGS